MKKICLFVCALICSVTTYAITISNGKITLSFNEKNGYLVSMVNETTHQEMLDGNAVDGPLWELLDTTGNVKAGQKMLQCTCSRMADNRLQIRWTTEGGVEAVATIRLDDAKPLSYWSIRVKGIKGMNLESMNFPVIRKIKDMGNEELAVSSWQGSLIRQPRQYVTEKQPVQHYAWWAPGNLTMQLITLYNKDKSGLYFASNDTLSYTRGYLMDFDKQYTTYAMNNFLDEDSNINEYAPKYEAVLGVYEGDWITAAGMYREWAVKQRWCRESRFHQGLTPEWAQHTALWVWNRENSENVLPEALDMKKLLGGLPVNVLWHWWHNCSYDEGFPEYIPPREGKTKFVDAVAAARKQGINSIVYMNSFEWGNSTESWKREGADRYCVRQRDGKDCSITANIFTGRQITPMCMATDFWRQKYAMLCDTVINSYGLSGVYMDQACCSYRCFSHQHGHSIGGGNYWVKGFGQLTDLIRSKTNPSRLAQTALAGEGSGEDWMSDLDLFLTLEGSRERYLGVGDVETIPLYQIVYHNYAITFGSYSSLVYPPYDDKWPDEFRPANRETELPEEFNYQYRMEQAKGFVWGTQPMLANYHSFLRKSRPAELAYLKQIVTTRYTAMKYLQYGVYTRCPEIETPKMNIAVSRISIYAGRRGNTVSKSEEEVPCLFTGGWKADDGDYAVAIANISDKALPLSLSLKLADYGLEKCDVYLISGSKRKLLLRNQTGRVDIRRQIAPRNANVIEFVKK